ncbi:caspase domain-containing protein [Mesorhizobium sp. LHD-90]|uniref:caspase family protein n=1 Tax=Mesorhizobium sp. LHD-90 TaxID=3071414 RepID=UPI0027DEFF1C|nr:caspase domain-containing protein [Mesorhizobium sp. LHD-90]MDQ6438120.1 caspase domain-containing protein [Mesorhizobium sp. LHD-90]
MLSAWVGRTMRVCFDALKVLSLLLVAVIAPTLVAQAAERRDVLVLGEQRRVGLVLGNSDYLTAQPLANAATDARAMEELLKSLDFEVISGFNLNKADTQKTIAQFAKVVRGAEIALFFYAGHGMQVSGVNYLIPVDAALEDETALDFEAVQIDFILRQMSRDTGIRLVFLDACRDNPLAEILSKSGGTGISSGLAEIQIENSGAGTLVAFATSPKQVAYDGAGANSPFSQALLAHLSEADVPLTSIMTRVTKEVFEATGGRQRPWVNVSLTDDVILNRTQSGAPSSEIAVAEQQPSGNSISRTAGTGANNPAADSEAQVALNALRQRIPKLETQGPIAFDMPIVFGDSRIDGKSIEELLQGKPLYPPVEGLDKSVWEFTCSNCHQWTKARLCEQAQNYDKIDVSIMRLEHPLGNRFKVALANWAHNDCK